MSTNMGILMRWTDATTKKVRKGWFGSEMRTVFECEPGPGEKLCIVSGDTGEAAVVGPGDLAERQADGKKTGAGDLFFSVFCAPTPFSLTIDAGTDADGFGWEWEVGGLLEILRPAPFARKFRGLVRKDAPLSADGFKQHLGSIPATVMHDKVVVDILGVMSLEDKDEEERYVDMRKRLEQSKEVGEELVSAALDAALAKFFEVGPDDKVLRMQVTSFKTRSPEREVRIAKAKKADDERENLAREVEKAELEKRLAALKGPRPEFRLQAYAVDGRSGVKTRDLVPVTSSSYAKTKTEAAASAAPAERLAIGDEVRFSLSANVDGWLHLYNYGTSGKVVQLFPGAYSSLPGSRIVAGKTYTAEPGGTLLSVPLRENGPTTAETGRLERFVAIVTTRDVSIAPDSIKKLFDGRNPAVFATRGGFSSVEDGASPAAEEPLDEAMCSILDLPPEEWVQGTLELEVV